MTELTPAQRRTVAVIEAELQRSSATTTSRSCTARWVRQRYDCGCYASLAPARQAVVQNRLARGRPRGRRAGGRRPVQLGQHPSRASQRGPGSRHHRGRRAGFRDRRGRPDRRAADGLDHARARRRTRGLAPVVAAGRRRRPPLPQLYRRAVTAPMRQPPGERASSCSRRCGCRSDSWPGRCSCTRGICPTTSPRRSPPGARTPVPGVDRAGTQGIVTEQDDRAASSASTGSDTRDHVAEG